MQRHCGPEAPSRRPSCALSHRRARWAGPDNWLQSCCRPVVCSVMVRRCGFAEGSNLLGPPAERCSHSSAANFRTRPEKNSHDQWLRAGGATRRPFSHFCWDTAWRIPSSKSEQVFTPKNTNRHTHSAFMAHHRPHLHLFEGQLGGGGGGRGLGPAAPSRGLQER